MPDFGSWGTAWWKPLLFIVVAGHITNVCVTLFLHRSQTHRSVKLHYLAALPMRLWLWLSTAIVTKEWVACHRKHHQTHLPISWIAKCDCQPAVLRCYVRTVSA